MSSAEYIFFSFPEAITITITVAGSLNFGNKKIEKKEEKNWLVNGAVTFSSFSSVNVFLCFCFCLTFLASQNNKSRSFPSSYKYVELR